MNYTVRISARARKALAALPARDYARVMAAINALAVDPRPPGCKKLQGRVGWRIRVGNYRVVYDIDDPARTVLIFDIGDRRDIYRRG